MTLTESVRHQNPSSHQFVAKLKFVQIIDGGQPDKVISVDDEIVAPVPERESKPDHAPPTGFTFWMSNFGNRKRAASQSVEAKKPPSIFQDDIAAALPEPESKPDHAPPTFWSNLGNRKRASSQSAEVKKPKIRRKLRIF